MKLKHSLLLAGIPLIGLCAAQTSQSYSDTTGDIDSNIGNHPHLDITSVDVTVNAAETQITFRINLAGSPLDSPNGTNWGKYLVAIRSNAGGASTGNAWGRPINFASGMTHWIGTWADAGGDACGGGTSTYSAPSWGGTSGPTVTKDATGITIVETVANLALGPGEVFSFDVYTSGGGNPDSAVDALSASAASITGWAGPYTTNAVGAGTNAALQFTMPGTSAFTTWVGGFGLDPLDQDPEDDPDNDGLTNQQEFDADLDLNPSLPDTDSDNLTDDLEDGSMVYNGVSDPGTFPAIFDSDGDGFGDGDEVNGAAMGFEADPTERNFNTLTVAGDFPENSGQHFAADGSAIGTDMTRTADTDLTGQFGWTLDYRVGVLGLKKYKFVGDHDWNNSWGVGGASGSDVFATFSATGIHRWAFNSKTDAYSLARVNFASQGDYLTAYGLSAGADEDSDGVLNEDEFAEMTDPKNPDTDGDGKSDLIDADPLNPIRNVEFRVNMKVQQGLQNFDPENDSVAVDFFDGVVAPLADLPLSDPDGDGIYTGTLPDLAGATDLNSGGYKFKMVKTGGDTFENSISNRSFTLGGGNPTQVLATVYFDNNSSLPYGSWAAAYAGSGAASADSDGDGVENGVEYFMGETGSSFTANPQPNAVGLISWPRDPAATDAAFMVWTSPDLSFWTDVTASADVSDPNSVKFTIPDNLPRNFVRFSVTVP